MGKLGAKKQELTPEELEQKHYRKFRTGFTYKEVSDMLWSYDEDPSTWHKGNATGYVGSDGKKKGTRRHCILRKWREIKQDMWAKVMHECGGFQGYLAWLENLKAQKEAA